MLLDLFCGISVDVLTSNYQWEQMSGPGPNYPATGPQSGDGYMIVISSTTSTVSLVLTLETVYRNGTKSISRNMTYSLLQIRKYIIWKLNSQSNCRPSVSCLSFVSLCVNNIPERYNGHSQLKICVQQ